MTEQLSLFDPTDENARVSVAIASAPLEVSAAATTRALVFSAPFSVALPARPTKSVAAERDPTLFGVLWPLGAIVKLDATVDRRVLREQSARLNALGYEFAPLSQDWHLAST